MDVDATVTLEVHESRRSAEFFLEPLGGYGGTSWLVPHPLFCAAIPATDDSKASFLASDLFFWGKMLKLYLSQPPSRIEPNGALEFEIRCGCVPRATKTTRHLG